MLGRSVVGQLMLKWWVVIMTATRLLQFGTRNLLQLSTTTGSAVVEAKTEVRELKRIQDVEPDQLARCLLAELPLAAKSHAAFCDADKKRRDWADKDCWVVWIFLHFWFFECSILNMQWWHQWLVIDKWATSIFPGWWALIEPCWSDQQEPFDFGFGEKTTRLAAICQAGVDCASNGRVIELPEDLQRPERPDWAYQGKQRKGAGYESERACGQLFSHPVPLSWWRSR